VRRLARRALEQLVEAVEIQLDEIGREAIRLRLGDEELACPVAVRREMPPEHRDERLKRARRVPRRLAFPAQVGAPVGRDAMPARREQDLEYLLRPRAAEVARAERADTVFDRKHAEQPDHRALATCFLFADAHYHSDRTGPVNVPV